MLKMDYFRILEYQIEKGNHTSCLMSETLNRKHMKSTNNKSLK